MTGQDIARQEPPSAQDLMIAGIRSEKFQAQVEIALPRDVSPARFSRIAITAIQTNADIALCDGDTVIRALLRCAQDGLLPDGREAAIVKRRNNKENKNDAVYQPMIGGFRKIAAEYGWTLRTQAVYANDQFAFTDQPPTISHAQVRPGAERGALIGAYAVATHRDGRREFKVMFKDDIEKRRKQATTDNVWKTWPAEMYEKTVGRDIFPELSLADGDKERIARMYEASLGSPEEAMLALYGPAKEPQAALPSAAAATPDPETDSTSVDRAGSQQAGVSAQATEAAALGADTDVAETSAPGDAPAAEPVQDVLYADEPDAEVKATGYNAPDGVEKDTAVLAAEHASQFKMPNGKHKGLALAEISALPDGEGWFKWALGKRDWQPVELGQTIFAFARVYLPDLYTELVGQA